MEKEYMNYSEAMKYLNIGSYGTLYQFIDNGLPVIVLNGTKRIRKSDIDDFMSDHTTIKEQ